MLINKTKVGTTACTHFIQVTVLFTTFTDTAVSVHQNQIGYLGLYCKDKNMEQVKRIDTVSQYNAYIGSDTHHPLVSVVNFSEIPSILHFKHYLGIYAVFLKNIKCGNMTYGCQPYDYEDGTMVFVSPGQVYGIDSEGVAIKPSGYALVFHPDLIKGTHLGKVIKDYSFFTYEVN